MRRQALSAACFLAAIAAANADTPEQVWKASLVQDNTDWAQKPEAILKIQDAAYLGENQSATLTGTRGKPDSYRWVGGTKPGVLVARFAGGHFSAVMNGKTIDEATLSKPFAIDKDIEIKGQATQVNAGVPGVRIFLFNQQAKAAKDFKGVDYFAYDPAYRVQASFKPDPKLVPLAFRTSRGTDKEFYHAGDATFTLQGKPFTLPFYAGEKDPKTITTFAAFFTDRLTGQETYGAGRYVDIEKFGAFPPKSFTIDFNYAYNPNCSRSNFFTCPVAIDNLDVAVKAGEKDPHIKH